MRRDIKTYEVLTLLASGSTIKEIAQSKQTDPKLLWGRIKRLHRRHGVKTTVQLIYLLTKQGRLK